MLQVVPALLAMAALAACSAPPQPALKPKLDARGPYLICATEAASKNFADSVEKLRRLHGDAELIIFAAGDLRGIGEKLRKRSPRYVLLFVEPHELDANFAWRWLSLTSRLDSDPFVDTRTGIITGATPTTVAVLADRLLSVAAGQVALPATFVDNLGPNSEAKPEDFFRNATSWMIPVMASRFNIFSLSHGSKAFDKGHFASMQDAGVIHFGGHGHPDRIDDGIRALSLAEFRLSPCIVFNGACYTGVTARWFDVFNQTGKVVKAAVEPASSFCLQMLDKPIFGYLAALHADHGVPVYQEMEYIAYSGNSLGDAIKYTQMGVIMANGGQPKSFPILVAGEQAPDWSAAEVMMNGTASRVLFGDPSLIVTDAFATAPFEVSCEPGENSLKVVATPKNLSLKSTFTDTYFSDMSAVPNQFNDRALIAVPLPPTWKGVDSVKVVSCRKGPDELRNRLVGYAVEADQGEARLLVQVDFETQGYMQSKFRDSATRLELLATKKMHAP
jgi:hypothetical protein